MVKRIAIDALGIHRYGGGRSAILNLLDALFQIDRKNQYDLFLSQSETSLPNNEQVHQYICPFRNRFLSRLWLQFIVPLCQKKWNLIHFTKNLGVFGHSLPNIVTIHDMTTVLYPEIFPRFDVWYWRHIGKITVQKAEMLIAVSHTTAQDIEKIYSISPDKIQVIHHGIDRNFHPKDLEAIQTTKRKYQIPDNYLLFVGHIDRKKNLPMLIHAFAKVTQTPAFNGKLVIVGEEYEKTREGTIYPLIRELDLVEDIILVGFVPDQDLPAIFSGATATLFSSYHEGFGLVALEAMACGSPLIASDAGAIREVTGEASRIVSSNDSSHFAQAILEVLENPTLQQKMREEGLVRASTFSWEAAAQKTLSLYEKYAR